MATSGTSNESRDEAPVGPPPMKPAVKKAVLAVLVVGALIKIAFLLVHMKAPDFASPCLDALYHDFLARGWGIGTWLVPASVPDPLVDKTPFARPPAYPLFLAVLYKVSSGSYVFARIAQLALGLLAAFFAAKLAHRLCPDDAIAPPAAAALTVLSPTLLYFEGELVAAGPTAAAGVGLVLALVTLKDRPRVGMALGVGVLIGILGLLRPNLLLFAPVAAAFVVVDVWKPLLWPSEKRGARKLGDLTTARPALVAALAMTVGALAITLPVTARNQTKSGEAIFISTNGGLTLLHGNHANADGVTMSLPKLPALKGVQEVSPFAYRKMVDVVATATKAPPSFASAEKWFRAQATDWIASAPGAFLRLTAKKAVLLLGPVEVSNNKQVALEHRANVVLRFLPVRWWVLSVLAALGGAAVWRRRKRLPDGEPLPSDLTGEASEDDALETTTSPGTKKAKAKRAKKNRRAKKAPGERKLADSAPSTAQAASSDAPRSPAQNESIALAAGLSIAFVAVGFLSVVVFLAASRFRAPLVPVMAALGGVGVAALYQHAKAKTFDGVFAVIAALALGITAVNWSGYAPDQVQFHRDRAQAFINTRTLPKAVAELERALAIAPNHPDVLVALGVIAGNQGNLQRALAMFAQAAKANPSNVQAQAQLGAAKLGLDDPAGALAAFDVVLSWTEGDATVHHNRGMALGRLGRHAEAKASFERALKVRPDFAPAKTMLERLR